MRNSLKHLRCTHFSYRETVKANCKLQQQGKLLFDIFLKHYLVFYCRYRSLLPYKGFKLMNFLKYILNWPKDWLDWLNNWLNNTDQTTIDEIAIAVLSSLILVFLVMYRKSAETQKSRLLLENKNRRLICRG